MVSSYGRGGAGNISNAAQAPLSYKDLQTPTLKSSVYTTGRGGTGNMAQNKDPREARLCQDVEPVVRRPSSGAQYAGRGGAGNIFHADEVKANKRDHAVDDTSSGKSIDFDSLASKGKDWLFGRK